MTQKLPALGKIPQAFFDRVIFPRLGHPDPRVLVGPRHGVDAAVIDIGHGRVMAMTTDPFYVVPQYGWEKAGWFAVHILASDLVNTGFAPQYLSIDLNLPPAMAEGELEELWDMVHRECKNLGVAVVTGHTGRYEGCDYPMVGGATMLAVGPADGYVSVGMSRPGDAVVVTKGPAVEAAGIMALTFRGRVEEAYGAKFADEAEEIFWQMSTVDDALAAASVGVRERGVTAMHDATECGVFGGLYEMARAARIGMEIDVAAIPRQEAVLKICDLFDMEPYTSISEGTLILTCVAKKADAVLEALEKKGIPAARVGSCTKEGAVRLTERGRSRVLEHPEVDPFWQAFAREMKR